jgi:hypothetical protein
MDWKTTLNTTFYGWENHKTLIYWYVFHDKYLQAYKFPPENGDMGVNWAIQNPRKNSSLKKLPKKENLESLLEKTDKLGQYSTI